MYDLVTPKQFSGFSGFSGVVVPEDTLHSGNVYYFTFDYGKLIELKTGEWVLSQLRHYLQTNYGYVISVNRALFSDRYVVVVQSTSQYTLSQWLTAFDYSWKAMGYDNVTLITAETSASAKVGGAPETISKLFSFMGETTYETVKPFLPWVLALGGIAVITVIYTMGKGSSFKEIARR